MTDNYWPQDQRDIEAREALKDAAVLPDGSGFFTMSLPLPADHWLTAPRCAEWDDQRDTTADTPHPILDRATHRAAVEAAIRYAVRGATMCGKDMDFDPDALVLNAIYALCGPAIGGATVHNEIARPAPEALPIAWMAEHEDDSKDFVNFYEDVCRQQAEDSGARRVIPLYAAPEALGAAKGVELSPSEIHAIANDVRRDLNRTEPDFTVAFARTILAAAKDQS